MIVPFPARAAIVAAYLAALYTSLGPTVAGTYLGGFYATIIGLLLLSINLLRWPAAWRSATLILGATAAWTLTIPLSPDPGFYDQHLRSLALLITSALAAYGIFLELSCWPAPKLSRMFTIIVIVILILAMLELYTPLKAVSDIIRQDLYSGRFIYSSDLRDITIHGSVRPKVFTQEPSHVARALSAAIVGALATGGHRHRYWLAAVAWGVASFLTGSPTMLLTLGGIVAIFVFGRRPTITGRTSNSWQFLRVAAVLAPVALLVSFERLAAFLPQARFQEIANGRDLSFVMRNDAPAMIAWETIVRFPFAGAGIGGRELVQDIVLQVYSRYPGVWIEGFQQGAGYLGWGNAFFEMIAYSGIVMGVILIPTLWFALGSFGPRLLVSLIFFLVFNFDSGFVSGRPWAYFAIIMAAMAAGGIGQNGVRSPRLPRHGR